MNFINPAMLAGLAALAIPIIVHLLNRRRFKKVPWAAMRFLRISVERNQRRMKVEDWILLLLRLAIVALIALALARPATDWLKSQFLGSKIAAAMVVDTSGSMNRTDVGAITNRFELARDAASEAVGTLPRGSASSVLLAADSAGGGVIEPTHDLDRATKTLKEAEPTHRDSDLLPAIEAALDSLEGRSAGTRELVVVTDGEATAWRQFEAIMRRIEAGGDDLRTVIALVGGKPGENLALTRLAQNTPVAAVGQPLRLAVEVTNFGLADADDVPVQLTIDGVPSGEPIQIESIPPGESRTMTLFARLPSAGFHQITASIPGGDASPADDSRVLIVRAIDRERALLVDGQPGRAPTESETFFLQNALVPVPPEVADSFFLAADRITVAELPAVDFSDYRVVFFANVAEFSTAVADRLTDFVRRGGGLVIFPGGNINRSFYNSELRESRSLLPAAFGDLIPGDAGTTLTLQASGYDHPLVELWNDPGAGTLANATVSKAFALTAGTGPDAAIGGTVVLRYNEGTPAVVESDFGLGKVYQFSSTADTEWNDLPVRPAFLPIVHRVFGSVLAKGDEGLNLAAGDTFTYRVGPEYAGRDAMIYSTGAGAAKGDLVEIEGDDSAARVSFSKTGRSGPYELSISDPALVVPFATTPNARESDPETLAASQLERLREVADVVDVSAGGSVAEALGRERSGSELWPLLLLAAGLLAILELFLSQRFSQEK